MSILCNLPPDEEMVGVTYLHHMSQANKHMKQAEAALRTIAKKAKRPDHRKHYDQAHKRLVRIRRLFNKTEQLREPPLELLPVPPIIWGTPAFPFRVYVMTPSEMAQYMPDNLPPNSPYLHVSEEVREKAKRQ